MAGYIIYIW